MGRGCASNDLLREGTRLLKNLEVRDDDGDVVGVALYLRDNSYWAFAIDQNGERIRLDWHRSSDEAARQIRNYWGM